MTSREQHPTEAARLQATIDRLALELAQERAAHNGTREELATARRRAASWRRIAEWIYRANRTPEENQP